MVFLVSRIKEERERLGSARAAVGSGLARTAEAIMAAALIMVSAELLLTGRERAFLAEYAIPSLNATPEAFTDADVDELVRTYAREGGFHGAEGLYRSLLSDADEVRALAAEPLPMPVLAVGGGSGEFTAATFRQVATELTAITLEGVGHYVAVEAPDRLSETMLAFFREVDARNSCPRRLRTRSRTAAGRDRKG